MTADVLDSVAVDWRPSARDDRAAIHAAIEATAAANDGLVHIADVRTHLDRDVDPHRIGAAICALVRRGVLVGTGQYRGNGNHRSRNRTRPAEVRYLAAPIPPEEP